MFHWGYLENYEWELLQEQKWLKEDWVTKAHPSMGDPCQMLGTYCTASTGCRSHFQGAVLYLVSPTQLRRLFFYFQASWLVSAFSRSLACGFTSLLYSIPELEVNLSLLSFTHSHRGLVNLVSIRDFLKYFELLTFCLIRVSCSMECFTFP